MDHSSYGLPVGTANVRSLIGILPDAALISHRRLWDTLEEVFAVRFRAVLAEPETAYAGIIEIDGGSTELPAALAQGLPRLTLMGTGSRTDVRDVRLLSHRSIDPVVRGIELFGLELGEPLDGTDATVLAISADGPAWTRAGADHDLVSSRLPAMESDPTLLGAIHGPCSLALTALIHLLRGVAAGPTERPPLRSTLVFDDPNLRAGRYGYIRYGELVAHADAHRYHAAMAMVPADANHWNRGVVELFRSRADRLSLAIHGNDHTRHELLSPPSSHEALSVCAQSLRRAARFEARTGLEISRVMVPPHSGWSRISARALGRLGFDAICTVQFQPSDEDPTAADGLAGFHPAEFVEGCAVLPRMPLSIWPTGVKLRAFLGHPLIVYGHHQDLADGLDLLAHTADVINGLGAVRWCSLAEIAATNFGVRQVGSILLVQPWALRLRIDVPDGVDRIAVLDPPLIDRSARLVGWSVSTVPGARLGWGEAVNVSVGSVGVRLECLDAVDPRDIAAPARSLRAVARRRLTEARDQLAPISAAGRRIHARAR